MAGEHAAGRANPVAIARGAGIGQAPGTDHPATGVEPPIAGLQVDADTLPNGPVTPVTPHAPGLLPPGFGDALGRALVVLHPTG
ncbi:hypothetical protein, partial [Enterobacter hormaechei]|uniref:hypothetical protein n=1 Tax=Enterobacter hormaechei TaxID=158836 RepID=UPI0013D86972